MKRVDRLNKGQQKIRLEQLEKQVSKCGLGSLEGNEGRDLIWLRNQKKRDFKKSK